MLAIHACVTQAPRKTGAVFGLRYQPWDAEYLGRGFEFTVFRTGHDEVLKIAHNSIFLPAHRQREYAEKRQHEYRHMSRWLGEFSLPQAVEVAPLPFLPSLTAVQVRQPYRQVIDPALFKPETTTVIAHNFEQLEAAHPQAADQLPDFIERSRSLHAAKDLLPDTNGEANLVVDGNDLRMIDGQPIGLEHLPVQQVILGQLDSLELAIA